MSNCPDNHVYARLLKLEEYCISIPSSISALMKRFEDIDARFRDLDILRISFQNACKAYDELKQKHDRLSQEFREKDKSWADCYEQLGHRQDTVQERLEENSKLVKQFDIGMFALRTALESVTKDVTLHAHRIPEVEKSLAIVTKRASDLFQEIEVLHKHADWTQSTFARHQELIDSRYQSICEKNKTLDNAILKANQDANASSDRLNAFAGQVQDRFIALSNQLGQEIESLQNALKSIPQLDTNAVKADVMKKIDSVVLDIENTVLRSKNNESSIKVLEKKVENIYLHLKKSELA